MSIDDVRTTVLNLLRKNQSGGYVSPSFFNELAKKIQYRWFDNKRVLYESSKRITADLLPLKENVTLVVTSGVATLPSDWWADDAVVYRSYYTQQGTDKSLLVPLEPVSTQEWASRIGSEAFAPTREFPIYQLRDGDKIDVMPRSIRQIEMWYIRKPTDPVWGYTTNSVGRAAYNSATSTDFEVPDYANTEIVNMFLEELGVSVRDGGVTEYAQMREKVEAAKNVN